MVIPDWTAPKAIKPKFEFEPKVELGSAENMARPLDRLAAVIVDIFVILVPCYILLSAPFKRGLTAGFILGSEPELVALILAMVGLGVALFVSYQALLHYFFGATFGKMLFDLKVRPVFRGEPLSFVACVGRSFAVIFECLCLGLPFLAVFSNARRRTLHDRLCDTVVISQSSSLVNAPAAWERGLVRGFFAAVIVLGLGVGAIETRRLLDKMKSEKMLSSLIEKDAGQCDVVTKNLDEQQTGEHTRLELAMSLYAAGLVDRGCLDSELEYEVAMQVPVGPITYLAQAFVNSEDAEVSNAYLDEVCSNAPGSVECAMSKVVSKWSDEDWKSVEQLLTSAQKGSGYLEVWAVRHFMKQAEYPQALTFLDSLSSHRELAEFSLVQRVKALYNSYAEAEAGVALAQALPALSKEEGDDLSAWMCAQELQNGCGSMAQLACKDIKPGTEISEIDFEHSSDALSRVMALECQKDSSLDYLTFSESVRDEDWQNFFRANLKHQKSDSQAAFRLYAEVISSANAPDLLRVEALRRLLQFADKQQAHAAVAMWRELDSKETWVKAGNLLFTYFAQNKDQAGALRVAQQLMNSKGLSPQSLSTLATLIDETPSNRKPASVPDAVKSLLNSTSEEGEQ